MTYQKGAILLEEKRPKIRSAGGASTTRTFVETGETGPVLAEQPVDTTG